MFMINNLSVRALISSVATFLMLSLGQRICVGVDVATVKYVGHIPQWPNTITYGIEWDNPTRGKNSGILDGVQYFRTEIDGAGSFIKASNKKIHLPISFMNALIHRYGGEENANALKRSIFLGLKVVENYGFEKLNTIQQDISLLKTVMLDKQDIGSCLDLPSFTVVELLDLSYNLLYNWSDVRHILQLFPKLRTLNLNGNRFVGTPPPFQTNEYLETVLLADTKITQQQLRLLILPHVRTLNLASNRLTSEACECINMVRLSKLDLSFNCLLEIPSSISGSSICELALAYNRVKLSSRIQFPSVTVLDLRGNDISNWDEIDQIAVIFPSLEELRVDDCPLFEKLSQEEITTSLIARLECTGSHKANHKIHKLNGSYILNQEIQNAELYFISKVKQGEIKFTNNRRWLHLLRKNCIANTQISVRLEFSDKILLHVFEIKNSIKNVFSRVFLRSNTILRLKGIICRCLNLRISDIIVFVTDNESDPFDTAAVRYLEDDTTTLQSSGLQDDQKIFVSW